MAAWVLMVGLDPGSPPQLAAQTSGVSPFGVFAAMRWVSVYHNSLLSFAGELLLALALIWALTTSCVLLAWPAAKERPTWSRVALQSLLSTVLSALLLAPSVVLLFGAAAIPLSWLFIAAVPAALLVVLILHPVAVSADWWKTPLSLQALGWVLAQFLVFSLAAAATALAPLWVSALVTSLVGLFNAFAWNSLVPAVVDRPASARIVPMVPAAIVVLVAVVIGGTVLGFSRAHPQSSALRAPAAAGRPGGHPVLIVSGYASTWDGQPKHPIPGSLDEVPFSYKGLTSSGAPRPYESADTVKPIPLLDGMLIRQIAVLHSETGRRVDVVAESEGALIAKSALMADTSAPVDSLVLASPIVAPGRVSYPEEGSQGWGVASAIGLRAVASAFQGVAPVNLSPNNAFLNSVRETGRTLAVATGCPLQGVRQAAILPLADATVTPPDVDFDYPTVVVAAFHGGLLTEATGEKIVSNALLGRSLGGNGFLEVAETTISSASEAWQVPTLAPSDYGDSGAGAAADNCKGAMNRLKRTLEASAVASPPGSEGR